MKKIVFNFLSTNYEITVKTYVNAKLYDKFGKKPTYCADVKDIIIEVFNLNVSEFDKYWDEWLLNKLTDFENKLVDIQYLIYEKTGMALDLKNPTWASMLDEKTSNYVDKLVHNR